MKRRAFLAGTGAALLASPLAAEGQPSGKVRRIGYLDQGSAARNRPYFEAFRQELRDLGWVEGQNIAIEVRFAEGKTDQLPTLAAELVRLKTDLIVTSSTPAALAAKQATTTIPIVIGLLPILLGAESLPALRARGATSRGGRTRVWSCARNIWTCSRKPFQRRFGLVSSGTQPTKYIDRR